MTKHEVLRTLGTDATGRAIVVKNGAYGPYVTDGTTNATIPTTISIDLEDQGAGLRASTQTDDSVATITLGEALALLRGRKSEVERRTRSGLGTDPETGRKIVIKDYGGSLVLSDGDINVGLPEGTDPDSFMLKEASRLLRLRREGKTQCGACGEYGHNRSACPQEKERLAKKKAKRVCKNCGESGHTTRACPEGQDFHDLDSLIDQASDDGTLTYREFKEWSGGEVYYRSRTLYKWLERVAVLKREGRYVEAVELLIHLVAGEELENATDGSVVSSCYSDLSIVLRKLRKLEAEVVLLRRWARLYPSDRRFDDRLTKTLAMQDKARPKAVKPNTTKRQPRCGTCGQTGHYRKTCPQKD